MVDERENETEAELREGVNTKKKEDEVRDLEKGKEEEDDVNNNNNDHEEFNLSRFHRLNPTNPLRIVINSSTRVATPPPTQSQSQSQRSHPRSIPIPQQQQPQPQPHQQVCSFFVLF